MDWVLSFLLWPKHEACGPWKQGKKNEDPQLAVRTTQMRLIRCYYGIWLCWLFRFWKGDQELEVRTATYGPVIDQSQHTKSVSHIINTGIQAIFPLGCGFQAMFMNESCFLAILFKLFLFVLLSLFLIMENKLTENGQVLSLLKHYGAGILDYLNRLNSV